MPNIFEKRVNYKPFEYPGIYTFTEAINKSFWVHSEIDFTADIQDFKSSLNKAEHSAFKRSLLSIAQIEVAVKSFWGDLYKHFPKPELNGLGSTFSECEFRHSEAYSRLLEVLGFNDEFENLIKVPVIKERIDYLTKALENKASEDKKLYVATLLTFSILIENVSLFSQFATAVSFTRSKGLMKNVSNIIAWTSIDEQVHANAGIWIINTIKEEQPELFDNEFYDIIKKTVKESITTEEKLVDWIFEEGELDFFSKEDLKNFMKYRLDNSLVSIGMGKMYNITDEQYKPMAWFEEEIFSNSLDDFFAKRPVDYTKHDKSISADDLF